MIFTNTRSNAAFPLAAIFIILFTLSSHAQKPSGEERIVETSWVKYARPFDWGTNPICPPEYMSKGSDSNNVDYGYWMSLSFVRDPYACILAVKISYPDGRDASLEDGKKHFTHYTPNVSKCLWLNTSDKEAKGLASINSFGYEVVGDKINKLEYPVNATIFVRKVGNDVYILKIGFDNNRYTMEQQKSITDAVYRSWQPLVKK